MPAFKAVIVEPLTGQPLASKKSGLLAPTKKLPEICPVPFKKARLLTSLSQTNLVHSVVTVALNLTTVLSVPAGEFTILPPVEAVAIVPIFILTLLEIGLYSPRSSPKASVLRPVLGPTAI